MALDTTAAETGALCYNVTRVMQRALPVGEGELSVTEKATVFVMFLYISNSRLKPMLGKHCAKNLLKRLEK